MSVKIDNAREVLKEGYSSLRDWILFNPMVTLKILGIVLAIIAVVLWLAIILNKHRNRANLSRASKTTRRQVRRYR